MMGEKYLTKPRQYAAVYGRGRSWTSNSIVIKALPNGLDFSRCGFSVGKRVGKAVVRNLVKRRLREITRSMPLEPGWDIIFIARSASAQAGYAGLKRTVEYLLDRAHLLPMARGTDGVPGENSTDVADTAG